MLLRTLDQPRDNHHGKRKDCRETIVISQLMLNIMTRIPTIMVVEVMIWDTL